MDTRTHACEPSEGLASQGTDVRHTLRRFGEWLTSKTEPPPTQENVRWLPLQRFHHILATADRIAEQNPRALPDLVHALLRPLQSRYLLGVAEVGKDPYPTIVAESFFGTAVGTYLARHGGTSRCGTSLDPSRFKLRLSCDTVLPSTWNYDSYVNTLAMLGSTKKIPGSYRPDKYWQWRQDPINHRVELWLPWGIGFVEGGNHSIAAGILAGEGELTPTSVFDMRVLLDNIQTDGSHYLCRRTGSTLAAVSDLHVAVVFEIGRLMLKHNVASCRWEVCSDDVAG